MIDGGLVLRGFLVALLRPVFDELDRRLYTAMGRLGFAMGWSWAWLIHQLKRRSRLVILPVGMAAAVAQAAEPVRHSFSVPSTIEVEIKPDGEISAATSTTRFEVYQHWPPIIRGSTPSPRLAQITERSRNEEGDEGTVSVVISDISTAAPRPVASFTDPGNKGTIITPYYFVSTVYGCCALPSRNRVRTLETGRELFTSTGSGQAGAAIWMSVPNARPTIERWAAFEGEMGRGTYSTSRRLGVFSYGGPDGPLSTVALVSKAWSPILESPETRAHLELMDTLSSCGTLGWIERGKRVRPLEGGCLPHNAYPGPSLFSLERKTAPEGIGGIAVELSALGTVYATIPVENDRLGLAHATVKEGIILTEQTKP